MPQLRSVKIEGFRSIKEMELELGRSTSALAPTERERAI